jgi:hypothetical protein
MKTEELEDFWDGMVSPNAGEEISGKRLPGMPKEMPVYAAVDRNGYRHILIKKLSQDKNIQFQTRGLDVNTSIFKIGNAQEAAYVDLICTNINQNRTFTVVASDLTQSITNSTKSLEDTIKEVLYRWRDFWTAKFSGMSMEETLGLFGEAWFMLRWFPKIDFHVIDIWQKSENARHDFQVGSTSIEVKVSNSRNSNYPNHHISGLEQLDDPESGELYLFSLQLTEDSLSSNTLHNIVREVQNRLANDFRALNEFNEKIVERGYSLDDTSNPAKGFRIIAERLFKVTGEFPRIIRRTFGNQGPPAGTSNIRYNIDLSACEEFLVATSPSDSGNPLSKT